MFTLCLPCRCLIIDIFVFLLLYYKFFFITVIIIIFFYYIFFFFFFFKFFFFFLHYFLSGKFYKQTKINNLQLDTCMYFPPERFVEAFLNPTSASLTTGIKKFVICTSICSFKLILYRSPHDGSLNKSCGLQKKNSEQWCRSECFVAFSFE